MKIFCPTRHRRHAPAFDYSDGVPPFEHLEKPSRIDGVLEGLARCGLTDVAPVDDLAADAVAQLHDDDYVAFLHALCEDLAEDEQFIPTIFHDDLDGAPLRFSAGRFCKEIGTPLSRGSLEAALNSAAAALQAANQTADTSRESFALCRPPGHHAGHRRYGGYCIFNNAYIAASAIVAAGHRPAVLDIDYHIGDGSIEFANGDAPYHSLHADTRTTYPYLQHLTERPHVSLVELPPDIAVADYVDLLRVELAKIAASSTHLVLSLGFDLLADDYIQDVVTAISAEDFEPIGQAIGALDMPQTLILEGGYDRDRLADCTQAFFAGFMPARADRSAAP